VSRVENIAERVVPRLTLSPNDLEPGTILYNIKRELIKEFENNKDFEVVFEGIAIKRVAINNSHK
jgi:hypothetical protein